MMKKDGKKMDEKWKIRWMKIGDGKKWMKRWNKKLVAKIIQTLDERLPKSDNVIEGTHENKGSIHVEQPSNNKHIQEDLTLIVELIMDGFLRVSTFPRLN
jgi:hypothetical protein